VPVTKETKTAASGSGATLETVLVQLDALPSISPREQRELASAVYSFARKVNRQPGEIPARLDAIERLGLELNAVRHGISMGRLRNLKSLVRRALKVTGNTAVTARLDIPLEYPWCACVDLFPDRRTRIALARLFRILQVSNIAPATVSTATFDRVLQYLRTTGTSRPEANYRELVLAWNRLVSLLRPYRT
jgi:hypothetical protein